MKASLLIIFALFWSLISCTYQTQMIPLAHGKYHVEVWTNRTRKTAIAGIENLAKKTCPGYEIEQVSYEYDPWSGLHRITWILVCP